MCAFHMVDVQADLEDRKRILSLGYWRDYNEVLWSGCWWPSYSVGAYHAWENRKAEQASLDHCEAYAGLQC